MSSRSNLSGILIMLLAVGTFAFMDAGLKLLTPHYPALQVATLRGAASIPFVLVWVCLTIGPRALLRIRWPLHLLRGALAILMMGAFVYAIARMPLSAAYTIFFVAPLIITALSVPILGERVGPRRWSAIVVGLVGVLVVLRPTGEGLLTLGGVAVFGAAIGYAVSAITVRVLSRTDSTQAMVFWMVTMLALGCGVLAAPDWVAIRPVDWPLIAGIGAAGAIGQYAVTEAFRRGEASVIAPFEYTALAWGIGLDVALWGVLPDRVTWIGAGIIIASGLYLVRRERDVEDAASLDEREHCEAKPP